MELFERIDFILQKKKSSRKELAEVLGVAQPTFNRYFSVNHQGKLAAYLWQIAKLWPDVSRNFLFFGEGDEDISPERISFDEVHALREKNAQLEAELTTERNLNRRLTSLLLRDSTEDSAEKTAKSAAGQK